MKAYMVSLLFALLPQLTINSALGAPTQVEGRIHAAAHEQNLYVLTWRNPQDFFDFKNYSLIPSSEEVRDLFKTLVRHDKVRVTAREVAQGSPQPHLAVTEMTILEKWQGAEENPRDWQPPEDFPTEGQLTGTVHAVAAEGRMLVIETKSGIYPVFVTRPEIAANLYRNDIVQLDYVLSSYPSRPPHLSENSEMSQPLVVLESILSRHQQPAEFEGELILFPKSPQINREIFALEIKGPYDTTRSFTLVPTGGQEAFDTVYRWLKDAWNTQLDQVTQERNWLKNPAIKVKVSGRLHVVSPRQANPQIFVESQDDITIEIDLN